MTECNKYQQYNSKQQQTEKNEQLATIKLQHCYHIKEARGNTIYTPVACLQHSILPILLRILLLSCSIKGEWERQRIFHFVFIAYSYYTYISSLLNFKIMGRKKGVTGLNFAPELWF